MNPSILLFGMPRRGTTLIGKLFYSHQDTRYRHETDSLRRLRLPLSPETQVAPQDREELEHLVISLPQLCCPKVVGKQPLFRKSDQRTAPLCAYRVGVALGKTVLRVRFKLSCAHGSTAGASGHAHLTWKFIQLPRQRSVRIDALTVAIA
ncbi:hypothetical protein [Oleiagrimonas sp.]|jgi:hypothetical protein|uniref:hypothetical protein n=1 Tax=Oleiagrimonas sp. TaxID=2010330 RepID=UPI0026082EEE|nr:hypothetical protein [Oleiagrimonas sp.]MDA3913505.1 hypothetical protein [Oleiagrimonas sp.]